MSRRKQARPIRLLEDEEDGPAALAVAGPPPPAPAAAVCDASGAEAAPQDYPEVLMCQRCQEQFTEIREYSSHKEECDKKAIKHDDPAHSDPEDMVISEEDDDEDEATGGKKLERIRRHRQDAANNNNNIDKTESTDENMINFPLCEPTAPGHVTLEALQNTKVAVAQFAATALANNADNETALQELAVLQSTLFTLQHQQVLQLQLINQLQHQLQIDRAREEDAPSSEHVSENETENASPVVSRQATPEGSAVREPTPIVSQPLETKLEIPAEITSAPNIPPQIQPPLCSISSSLASTIITHSNDPPSMDEPNTLEMLQKRAQEVLDNASQGLLATNLADELAFRKSKGSVSPYDSKGRNEPFFKHRCRYCGKVFGSDSALQIHIRSHTGERPYKCNVCGSRFTTKGNLKVHFQRHSAKFPHIKMNPNPVPEHLDKYHPPLLAQLGQQTPLSPGGAPPHLGLPSHSYPPTSLSLFRPHIPPPPELNSRLQPSPHTPPQRMFPSHPLFIKREEQETAADLSKPQRSPSPLSYQPKNKNDSELPLSDPEKRLRDEDCQTPKITPKQEPNDPENEAEQEHEGYSSPLRYDECSNDSKYSNENMSEQRSPELQSGNVQEEPENLSNRSNSISVPLSISTSQRIPQNFSFGPTSSPPSSTSSGSLGNFPSTPMADITKDPAIYTNLLPRPGSNDNSWESLIEVTKTSETSKLQQLVDNIEHKLSDPNQCVICHRVLSCKSALQMHYRTHTGERPFKCKICGRAFTTKGNLKTHMGVHRAKPPMRVLHQCPVCHKKFTNALVLQQHIRLHTGEPTDLTPEQIQAAEVKEFPGSFPGLNSSMHPFLNQNFSVPGLSPVGNPNLSMSLKYERDGRSDHGSMDDDDDDDISNSDTHTSLPPFSSPSETYNQNTATTPGSSLFNMMDINSSAEDLCFSTQIPSSVASSLPNGNASPSPRPQSPEPSEIQSPVHQITPNTVQVPRPPSAQPANPAAASPTPSDCNSMGALDLTPRQQQQQPQHHHHHHQPTQPSPVPGLPQRPGSGPGTPAPPPSLFSAFLSQPVQGAPCGLMSSALSSLTSSVLTSTSFSPLRLAVGPTGNLGRGNTTCHLCFKTFACNSALEIHFRSHTKERPFKCTVCDRGFSTKNGCKCNKQRRISEDAKPWRARNRNPSQQKISPVFPLSMNSRYASSWLHGNMKQHMLTHKIRDMPQHMFENKTPSQSGDEGSHLPSNIPKEQPSSEEQKHRQSPRVSSPPPQGSEIKDQPVKREPTETELPLPKRPISLQASKHLCQVCNKNFSSSSALQIHMRTHTGDKPFRCTVCQKAFTTKGNLKVHMGTHMWNNGASRRGRRMSLDLPPIPMTPKDSEFLQRRPDLFYPYLPAPFLNGMQKLNDMSTVAPNQNGLSPGKYGGLVGFGYPPTDALRSQASPTERSERPASEPESRPNAGSLWDLHFERSTTDGPRDDILPAGREGLAA